VICIETAQSNQGICIGDSGGVLSVVHNGQSLQVGIQKFVASGGCVAGFPSGATSECFEKCKKKYFLTMNFCLFQERHFTMRGFTRELMNKNVWLFLKIYENV
jgi:hypothetical protein